ncbi:MAG: glycosyltransferase family 9 protein [Clostridia bacterium]|nr:glycosyltransferase family 9 protein [Clostridia bacterium]
MNSKSYISNFFIIINNILQKNTLIRKIKQIMYFIDWILLFFIKKPRKKESSKKKVLIIYNLALGDTVVFSCALKNIRKMYPKEEYEVIIACQKGLNKIYEKLEIFDKVIPLDFMKAAVNLKERYLLFKKLREEYYDIIIDPIGPEECTTNVLITRGVVGKEKISVINIDRKIYCPKFMYKKIYDKIIEIHNEKITLIEHYYEFFNKLTNNKFNISFIDLPSKEVEMDIPKEYFIIYPSASSKLKKWPIDRFAKIAQKIVDKTGLPLILCGTKVDKEDNDKLKQLVPGIEILDFTDKTQILEFIGIIKNAKFVITNDTGIYHISVISQVPVTIVAGGYTYNRYMKYEFENNYKKPYVVIEKQQCFNCENRCKYTKEMNAIWPCLDKITVDQAWKVIENMIDNEYK